MAAVAESSKPAEAAKMPGAEAAAGETPRAALKPLRLLVPYILRYRVRASFAFISLVVAVVYQRFVLRRDTEGAITRGRI